MYTVINYETKTPTGVTYNDLTKEIEFFHNGQGEVLLEVTSPPINLETDPELPERYAPVPSLVLEGGLIVNYLSNYLNSKANEYGYDSYHTAMLYLNSSYPKFKQEAQAFFACADAIWAYVEENRESFVTTGHLNLEEVKLAHPRLDDFLL